MQKLKLWEAAAAVRLQAVLTRMNLGDKENCVNLLRRWEDVDDIEGQTIRLQVDGVG